MRVLETFRRVDLLLLDKTGTLTEGDFRVRHAALEHLDYTGKSRCVFKRPVAPEGKQ